MDAKNLELAQAELDRLEFINLITEADARNDGSFLAICAVIGVDHGHTELLEGHTADDYQKALMALQWGLENAQPPLDKHLFQAAIDYIRTHFLSDEVKS